MKRSERKSPEMKNDGIKAVADSIRANRSFLVTSHVNPEGDAIGSQLAVGELLKELSKRYELVNADEVPANLKFLSGTDRIMRSAPEGFEPDAIIVLDCPVPARCGCVTDILSSVDTVINIDHHVSNGLFGDINWVEGSRSSVGEMVHELFMFMGVELTRESAEHIYSAMVTDTGVFTYTNTTPRTHVLASKLLEAGIVPADLHRELFEARSFKHVELLGKVLTTLELASEGRIAHITMMHQMFSNTDMNDVPTDEFITFPRSIRGVEVALFFKEFPELSGKVGVSFRSSGKVDVNAIASKFGGGGHRLASGCTVEGVLEKVKLEILSHVEKQIEQTHG